MANFGEEQEVSVVASWPQNGDATIIYVLIVGALLLSFLVLLVSLGLPRIKLFGSYQQA